jgi:hypothetical protein
VQVSAVVKYPEIHVQIGGFSVKSEQIMQSSEEQVLHFLGQSREN